MELGWRAAVEVDLDAIADNVALLRQLAGRSLLCAIVKANGYGHGAVEVALAALAAGADWLGVAHAAEGLALRNAGIDVPILLLSEPVPGEEEAVLEAELRCVLYSSSGIGRLAACAQSYRRTVPVHVKVDTGMGRVGAAVQDVLALAHLIVAEPALKLEGLMTHFAKADKPADPFTTLQLQRFSEVAAMLERSGLRPPMLHASNSAGLLAHPSATFDLVRPGIALYGIAPAPGLPGIAGLRPALSLRSSVRFVKIVEAGQGVSYGLQGRLLEDSVVATVPIGYADGIPRRLADLGGAVLIRGRRRPMLPVLTMDQLLVNCGGLGPGGGNDVEVGDEVVMLGRQGSERIDPDEWAGLLGTISYEIVTGLGPRLPRTYVRPTSLSVPLEGFR